MPRLTGVMHRLGGRPGDRGAVAALVGLLLSGGVLLGMAALVVDVGLLYAEREELQTGADAAAMAVARACVGGSSGCTSANATADDYASANAKDRLANATVCGFVPANPAIPGCGAPVGNLTDCIGPRPAPPTPFVEVRTTTETAGGNLLPPAFAGAVTGTNGTTVGACSRVSWGPVHTATTELGLAICERQFDAATLQGGARVFQPPPIGGAYGAVDADKEVMLRWRSGTDPDTSCNGAPDGFRWIAGDSSTCSRSIAVSTVVPGTVTLDETSTDCGDVLEELVRNPRPAPVAIYAKDDATGDIVTTGIAAFVPTGWRYRGSVWNRGPTPRRQPSPIGGDLCGTPPRTATICLYGYFTTKLFATGSGPVDAENFGAIYLKTIG